MEPWNSSLHLRPVGSTVKLSGVVDQAATLCLGKNFGPVIRVGGGRLARGSLASDRCASTRNQLNAEAWTVAVQSVRIRPARASLASSPVLPAEACVHVDFAATTYIVSLAGNPNEYMEGEGLLPSCQVVDLRRAATHGVVLMDAARDACAAQVFDFLGWIGDHRIRIIFTPRLL